MQNHSKVTGKIELCLKCNTNTSGKSNCMHARKKKIYSAKFNLAKYWFAAQFPTWGIVRMSGTFQIILAHTHTHGHRIIPVGKIQPHSSVQCI